MTLQEAIKDQYKKNLASMSIQQLRKHARWLYREDWIEDAKAVARLADKYKKEQS